MDQRNGQCLCGAIKVKATLLQPEIQACHCVQCQRWTGGGPHFALWVKDLEIDGATNLNSYRASEWGERANCKNCGSIIYWKMQGKDPDSIAVGLLDDQSGLTLSEEIFVDRRAAWAHPVETANQSTEAEQIAKFDAYMARQNDK